MKLSKLTQAFVCLFLPLYFSGTAAATSTAGSQTITLSTAPTQLACSSQRYVNKLTVRVIPGGSGKVYVGTSSLNTSTYAGTLSILFPNGGAHSEEYVVRDLSGDDGIDLCGIYIAGGVAGETAIADFVSNSGGTVAPTYLLVPAFVKPVTNNGLVALLSPAGTYFFSVLRAQIIPGNSGKQHVYPCSATDSCVEAATLYPNTGNLAQHSAWSEFWEQTDLVGNNGLWIGTNTGYYGATVSADFSFIPDIGVQQVLVSLWQKQTSSGTVEAPAVSWLFGNTYDGSDIHIRVVPGYGDKLSLGVGPVGAEQFYSEYAELFPNTTGSLGWSEAEAMGPQAGFKFTLGSLPAYGVAGSDMGTNGVGIDFTSLTPLTSLSNSNLPQSLRSLGSTIGNVNQSVDNAECTYYCVYAAGPTFPATHLEVAVIPGGEGKLYVGSCTSMNTSTLAGVYAILYPNSFGRWSEHFILDDPEGDGIPSMCVTPEISGEKYECHTTNTGVIPTDGVMSVKASGPLSGSGSASPVSFISTSTPISILRAQAIPGGSGKLWIGNSSMTASQPDYSYANVLKVLWPSEGNYGVAEGFSETYNSSCLKAAGSAPNCLDLSSFKFWPYVSTEQLLVFALGR